MLSKKGENQTTFGGGVFFKGTLARSWREVTRVRTMLMLPFVLLAQNGATGSKRCDHKELRSADGLVDCSSLDFHFDPLSATEIKAVAKAVSSGEIRVFICRGCEIGAAGMEVLGPALLSQDSIDFLTLREDTLGASGANYLAQLLNQSNELSGLDLRGAGLEKDDSALAAALRHPDSALEILNLKYSGMGPVGAAEVAAALAVNKELQWLDLSFTSLGDEGAAVLAASLAERDEPLSLHLEDKSLGEGAGRQKSPLRTRPSCMGMEPLHRLRWPAPLA
jgi:hypothetical protein